MEESQRWRDAPARSTGDLQESNGVSSRAAPDESPESIPVSFYSGVLHRLCTTPEEQRFWYICAAVLRDACKRLDPRRLGLQLSIVQCMAPVVGNTVCCLGERVALGTPPWGEDLEKQGRLFGAESLAGYATATGHRQVIAGAATEQWRSSQLPEHAMSAAACPITYMGRAAGCLLAVSTRPGFFDRPARLDVIGNYAQLLALAFRPEDFYERERFDLRILPSLHEQQPYISTLPQRILALLKKAALEQLPISYEVAEQRAMWQVAAELL